ncbi:CPBP family intramembrane glutamic endopeptidase [Tenacibaculum sp. MEBiC06402]|uniref:CPBP family intramembrane glutamic endopeptidase n=1 Tax=unclassified Tenacibaculum TaxID=2635139 RepID=UPI003B9AE406
MNGKLTSKQLNPTSFFFDIILYLTIMFLVREVYFSKLPFIGNGLIWSCTTLIIAIWRMKVRNITWKDIGLRKPKNLLRTFLITIGILITIPISIILFQQIQELLPISLAPDTSAEDSTSKFGNLKGNWIHFLTIIPFILLQSALEELLDRGFLINWFERFFSKMPFATATAVLLQAIIFGFRHSYDISERSITVAIIGLIMGMAYVKFGRNLWPIIMAHCILNTISMIGKI